MKNLNEDINRQKDLMNIVSLSDLQDAGTWSSEILTRKKEGREIFTLENGKLSKREKEPKLRGSRSPGWGYKQKDIFYLTPNEAESVNGMLEMIREYESKVKELRKQIKSFLGDYKK